MLAVIWYAVLTSHLLEQTKKSADAAREAALQAKNFFDLSFKIVRADKAAILEPNVTGINGLFLYINNRGKTAALNITSIASQAADNAQIVKDFEARIGGYVDLEKKQAGSPKPTDSADKLAENREQMAEKMRAARPDAKPGDIFSPEVAAYFRQQIAATLSGHDGKKIRTSLRHAEPVHAVLLRVNGHYREDVPLQSTPPTLLLNLPRLPHELQYRIVGHHLMLYDTQADLIVDFIQDAMATAKKPRGNR